MKKTQKYSVIDFINAVKTVAKVDAKNVHTVQIFLRSMDNAKQVRDFMNSYGIASNQNKTGFVINMSYNMSTPARKIMDSLCRVRGNCAHARQTHDAMMSARFQRDFSLLSNDNIPGNVRYSAGCANQSDMMAKRFMNDLSR